MLKADVQFVYSEEQQYDHQTCPCKTVSCFSLFLSIKVQLKLQVQCRQKTRDAVPV